MKPLWRKYITGLSSPIEEIINPFGLYEVEKICQKLGIKHTTTKVKHPWTNSFVERLKKALLDEFHSVAFRKKQYERIEKLQIDLDNFMDDYD
jgi:transposase InsO family protein